MQAERVLIKLENLSFGRKIMHLAKENKMVSSKKIHDIIIKFAYLNIYISEYPLVLMCSNM